MNRLSTDKRARIIGCLVEGNSIRATVRMTGHSKARIRIPNVTPTASAPAARLTGVRSGRRKLASRFATDALVVWPSDAPLCPRQPAGTGESQALKIQGTTEREVETAGDAGSLRRPVGLTAIQGLRGDSAASELC